MTQQEVIKNFLTTLKNNSTLSGRAALDAAIKATSKFNTYEELTQKFYQDFVAEENWHTFLVKKCGIIIDNADTGAITGSDAGGTEKTKDTVIPSTAEEKYPEGSSFTINGLTIYGIPEKSTLTETQQYIVKGLYSWWLKDSLDLIKESYGLEFDENANNTRLKLEFMNDPNDDALAYCSYSDSTDGRDYEARTMTVNLARFEDMDLTSRHGSSTPTAKNPNAMQLDRTLVHELVHGIMAANIPYFADFPHFFSEGGTAELVHGIDDERRQNIISYTQDRTYEPFKKSLLLESAGFNLPYEAYACGYIFMRYFAKQAGTDTTFDYDTYRSNVTIGSSGGFEVNYYDEATMTGGKGSDTVANSGQDVTIDTKGGKDYVNNYNDLVYITTGAGADSVHNTAESVVADGDAGADSFINEGNKSQIYGGAGKDTIINTPDSYATIDSSSKVILPEGTSLDDDFMISLTNGTTLETATITLEGGAFSTIYGGAGNDSIINNSTKVIVYGDAGIDYIGNSGNNSTVYGGAGNDIIANGSSTLTISGATAYITGYNSKIYGENGNDSISNAATGVKIYGGEDNDTLSNSAVSVKIYGDDGEDHLYNTGKDVVLNGGADDDFIVNESVAESVTAYGGAGNDVIRNQAVKAKLYGGEDADYIYNYGDESQIIGGAGNDTVYNSGKEVTVKAGAGVDYVKNEGVSDYINLGAGNDTLVNEGDHATIIGGYGNDYISNSGKGTVYRFGSGAGNDTVIGASNDDTLRITSGTYSTVASGNNLTVYVGEDSITFQNLGTNNLVISRGNKKVSVSVDTNALLSENENNFSEFDEILDDKFAVAEFENYKTASQQESLITFAE